MSWKLGKDIYHHGNHPIKWVRITGVIVAVDEFSARKVYTIDDSSGMRIECTCPAPPSLPSLPASPGNLNQHPVPSTSAANSKDKAKIPSIAEPLVPWDELDVGVVVKIKGKPGQFRKMMQIEVVKADVIRSTEQEVRCWNEVSTFRKEVLNIPWVVDEEDEENLRQRAQRERQFSRGKGKDGRPKESEDSRRKRKDAERRQKTDESKKPAKEKKGNGLGPENRINYPSLAMRRMLAEKVKGKYDALGI
jgi:hypothetical protein